MAAQYVVGWHPRGSGPEPLDMLLAMDLASAKNVLASELRRSLEYAASEQDAHLTHGLSAVLEQVQSWSGPGHATGPDNYVYYIVPYTPEVQACLDY